MKNKIYQNDCFEFMKGKNDIVDIILTSPPYNMTKRKGGWSDKTSRYDEYQDWMEYNEYIEWSVKLFKSFNTILKSNGVVLYNFSYSIENPSLPYLIVSEIIKNTNFVIADTITWKKYTSMPYPSSPNRLQRICEFVFVFVRSNEIDTFYTNKQLIKISKKTNQKYYKPMDNFIIAKNNDIPTPDINQATFSSDLVLKLLNMYANKKSVIYDPFMGTGSTAVGCIKYGCFYIGTELSKSQIEYSIDRISKISIDEEFF